MTALVAVLSASAAWGDTAYPIPPATAKANEAKVRAHEKDARWKGAPLAACQVEAMSGIRRTPDLFPEDGDFLGPVRVVLARDEYEGASVLLYGFEDVRDVTVEPAALAREDGVSLAAAACDVKVVKVWYQQGTAWGSYFSDSTRRVATPELLLHDDALVEVDHVRKENFLRCDERGGTRYRWISFGPSAVNHRSDGGIENAWVHDAPTLRPFPVRKGEFRQLMLTFRAGPEQKGGLYRGAFAVKAGGRRLFDLPVEVRVLDFALPLPATFRDTSRRFFCVPYMGSLDPVDHAGLARNMVAHNVRNCLLRQIVTPSRAEKAKRVFAETGFDQEYLFCALPGCGVRTSYPPSGDDAGYVKHLDSKLRVEQAMAALREAFGANVKAYSYGIDEGSARTVREERATWQNVHAAGGRTVVATQYHPYILFNLDFANVPRQPRKAKRADADDYHAGNPDGLMGWYADPHSGPENPDYARRLYGWQTWRNNYDCSCQYILFRDNWNDFWVPAEAFLRGLMLAYPQDGDLLDTLQWEGVREAMDDVRYNTYLKQLVEKCRAAKDIQTVYAGRAAATWLAQVDCERSKLGYLRAEAVARILDLTRRLEKEGK